MRRGQPLVRLSAPRFRLRRPPMPEGLRDFVWGRDKGLCVICGLPLDPDRWECHHRKLRSQGGRDEATNLISLHGSCHAHAHGNRTWARERGYIVHPNDDPATCPVLRHGRRWQSPIAGQWVGAHPPADLDEQGAA